LKPQNLLVNEDMSMKIADFGLARVEGIPVKKYSHEAVTLWYRSPDVILGSANYGLAVDTWSIGCIFAEMVIGSPLFNSKTDHDQILRMFKLFGSGDYADAFNPFPSMPTFPGTAAILQHRDLNMRYESCFDVFVQSTRLKELSPEGIDLLVKMLQFEPTRRITTTDALAHPYFEPIRQSLPKKRSDSSISKPPSTIAVAAVHLSSPERQPIDMMMKTIDRERVQLENGGPINAYE
jgi:cyclin-dependent kinase